MLGIGENSIDRVCLVDGLPRFAEKAPLHGYRELPGGQVATAALACTRLGLRAAYVGAVGDDPAGRAVLEPLREAGVDLAGVKVVPGAPTRSAVILVDRESGERSVLEYRDPRLSLRPADLSRSAIESARALYLDARDPEAATWAAGVGRAAGIPVVLDADAPGPGIRELLTKVDFPIVSRDFAESFGQGGSALSGLAELAELGAHLAVVTLGEEGALALFRGRLIESPAFRVEVRDTTGAGDVFHAAFVWALLEGMDVESALRAANAAAAISCRGLGAQGTLPGRDALESFLHEREPGPGRGPGAEPG